MLHRLHHPVPSCLWFVQERNNLAAEIQSMQTHGLTERDFLELNVGGKVISTTRETLMQASGVSLTGPGCSVVTLLLFGKS